MNRCSPLRQTDWASGPHASQPLASGHPGEGGGITSEGLWTGPLHQRRVTLQRGGRCVPFTASAPSLRGGDVWAPAWERWSGRSTNSIATLAKGYNTSDSRAECWLQVSSVIFFSVTVYIPIWFCISVGCTAQWLDIMCFTKCSPAISSIHPAPYRVITMSLTLFPMLYLISLWLFCSYQFALLNLFTFPPIFPGCYTCATRPPSDKYYLF